MLVQLVILSALAAIGHASPILHARADNDTNPFVFTNYNGLNFTQMNITLPIEDWEQGIDISVKPKSQSPPLLGIPLT